MSDPAMKNPLALPLAALAGFLRNCDPAMWQQAVATLRDTPGVGAETKLSASLMEIPWRQMAS